MAPLSNVSLGIMCTVGALTCLKIRADDATREPRRGCVCRDLSSVQLHPPNEPGTLSALGHFPASFSLLPLRVESSVVSDPPRGASDRA